eukprot:13786131-Ditylum_brightwellii.AAC.1
MESEITKVYPWLNGGPYSVPSGEGLGAGEFSVGTGVAMSSDLTHPTGCDSGGESPVTGGVPSSFSISAAAAAAAAACLAAATAACSLLHLELGL